MRLRPLILLALTACSLPIASCASSGPPSALTAPPQRDLPDLARRPCELPRLPDHATQADLETLVVSRGVAILSCDAARQLAVDVHDGQTADQTTWLRESAVRRAPWWRRSP